MGRPRTLPPRLRIVTSDDARWEVEMMARRYGTTRHVVERFLVRQQLARRRRRREAA